ncbi:MAG: isocitrate lyase/phosphoenolpyruvate mutase family protein, partial [Beijerinckiaceae bacterium]|nr:isocitrate lyase/phosphoenolpyruvate mutase family protein [Beijerinckiaceae bacterium]
DHGYGNALNVMRTVEELENAGVSGLTIEDTDLPRPFGQAKPRLLPLREGIGKMRAAIAARQETDLCVFARTSALGITGQDDMLERLKAYQDTGRGVSGWRHEKIRNRGYRQNGDRPGIAGRDRSRYR